MGNRFKINSQKMKTPYTVALLACVASAAPNSEA